MAASQGGGVMVNSHGDRSYNPMTTMISAVATFRLENDKELISKQRFVLVKTHKLDVCCSSLLQIKGVYLNLI